MSMSKKGTIALAGVIILVMIFVAIGYRETSLLHSKKKWYLPTGTQPVDATGTQAEHATDTYTLSTYGISFRVPSGTFDEGTSSFDWQSGCSYSDPMSKYLSDSPFTGFSSGGEMYVYVVCKPLSIILANPTALESIRSLAATTTRTGIIMVGTKKAYLFTGTASYDASTTAITVLTALGTSTLDIVFDDSGVGLNTTESVWSTHHPYLVYPSYYKKILSSFVFSTPVPLPVPKISSEEALALVEKRPGVQKWLANFGGQVGGVSPVTGNIASIDIVSETTNSYSIEVAEITQVLTVADAWYTVDKTTGSVTNITLND